MWSPKLSSRNDVSRCFYTVLLVLSCLTLLGLSQLRLCLLVDHLFISLTQNDLCHFFSVFTSKQVSVSLPAQLLSGTGGRPALQPPGSLDDCAAEREALLEGAGEPQAPSRGVTT